MTWFRRSAHPEDDLSAYVDGELDERARRAVETHLASCEACSTLLRELQDTKSLLSGLPRLVPQRSFRLGAEHAVEWRPAPKRMSFTFAPAVALTVLVALLFVDAANFSTGGSSDDDNGFSTAASTGSRQAQPEAAGGLAIESSSEDAGPNTGGGAASSAESGAGTDAGAAGATDAAEPAGAPADGPENAPLAASAADSAADGEAGDPPADTSALAPPSQNATAEEPEASPEALAFEVDEDAASASTAAGPEDDSSTAHVLGEDSGGLSTLRILEIAAALAFAGSLAVVFLPRIVGRKER
jgi:hypothetical protein